MSHYYGLVPAAGTGSRMGVDLPKQYLQIAGRPMIYYAVRAMASSPRIAQVFVVLAADDAWWDEYDWAEFAGKLQVLRCGGATRADSVTNGLAAMGVDAQDWVLVHDAARPCLTGAMIASLIDAVGETEIGGLLAIPVADTLKRARGLHVSATEPREGLWQAQTPQMFRHAMLQQALSLDNGFIPTDEASAMEALGHAPLLVAADSSNFKVTYPNDLTMARLMLAQERAET
ncbi:2-C-methyl-D-erythritol 4-phosphate cytidylyltransferase [Sulfuriferula sp. AH1]|uniref:2-C-methyl-D-erythritol 4-phosphate cytidylyltransferase n=1 Tax=Sulfuriferula sp. AH1 TaxID=1985873 RepID=UPI000B3B40BF|nr:2-C-methyl-D-erythritol 4-phosphate cytidylyltransferase [Sulfuriferula sp. AH1]ARU31891.1 2-C-methyl-D-erythritol 4-phosphate cytidylyltransferase [Sulfuriferula sp. AH1]